MLGESSVVCRDVNSKILKIRAKQRLQVSFHATPGEWVRKYVMKGTSAAYTTLASIVVFSMRSTKLTEQSDTDHSIDINQ